MYMEQDVDCGQIILYHWTTNLELFVVFVANSRWLLLYWTTTEGTFVRLTLWHVVIRHLQINFIIIIIMIIVIIIIKTNYISHMGTLCSSLCIHVMM